MTPFARHSATSAAWTGNCTTRPTPWLHGLVERRWTTNRALVFHYENNNNIHGSPCCSGNCSEGKRLGLYSGLYRTSLLSLMVGQKVAWGNDVVRPIQPRGLDRSRLMSRKCEADPPRVFLLSNPHIQPVPQTCK